MLARTSGTIEEAALDLSQLRANSQIDRSHLALDHAVAQPHSLPGHHQPALTPDWAPAQWSRSTDRLSPAGTRSRTSDDAANCPSATRTAPVSSSGSICASRRRMRAATASASFTTSCSTALQIAVALLGKARLPARQAAACGALLRPHAVAACASRSACCPSCRPRSRPASNDAARLPREPVGHSS